MAIDRVPTGPPDEEAISPARKYLSLAIRRWWLVVSCVALAGVAAYVVTSRQPKKYTASAAVQVSRQNLAYALTGTPDPVAGTSDFQAILQTQAELAQSPEIATVIPKGAGVSADQLLADASVEPQTTADVLTFHVSGPTPDRAVTRTNVLANAYVALRERLDAQGVSRAIKTARLGLNRERSRNGNSPLADSLANKVQQLQTLQALQTPSATVISPADAASKTAPKITRAVAVGLVIGTALAGILLALLEAVDTRVRSASEVRRRLGLPVLGRVWPVGPGRRGGAASRESVDLLRARLEHLGLGGDARTVAVARAADVEPRVPLAIDLAKALARSDRRVALVEFGQSINGATDVVTSSRPVLASLPAGTGMEIEAAPAADEALAGGNGSGSLELLRVTTPLEASQGTTSHEVRLVLERLRETADIIVVDAPAARSALGVAILASGVDIGLICVPLPDTTRPQLDDLAEALPAFGIETLGVVIVEPRRSARRR